MERMNENDLNFHLIRSVPVRRQQRKATLLIIISTFHVQLRTAVKIRRPSSFIGTVATLLSDSE